MAEEPLFQARVVSTFNSLSWGKNNIKPGSQVTKNISEYVFDFAQ